MTGADLRIGLKLWSENVALASRAVALHAEGWIDLVELYVVPGTYAATVDVWRALGVPYMLHCPHAKHQFNLAKPELRDSNAEKFDEVRRFADALSAPVIVMHGGNRGDIGEAIRQLRGLADERIFIENKPKVSLTGGLCIGHSPEEIERILAGAGLRGMVLDFGHAICAANSAGANPLDYIERFLALSPRVFHIGDGDVRSEKDNHFNFGEGTFDIQRLASYVPAQSTLTIETPTDQEKELLDFIDNVRYLRAALERSNGGADAR